MVGKIGALFSLFDSTRVYKVLTKGTPSALYSKAIDVP